MLDDGKAQAGAAGGLAAAFVHTVEPLKHAGLAVLRDADAVVLDLQPRAVGAGAAAQFHVAAGLVVADGIIAQVGGKLGQQVLAALHGGGLGVVLQRHVGLAGIDRHVLRGLFDQRSQVDRRHLDRLFAALAGLGAVQLAQLQDIADQRDHALRFLMDARRKGGHVSRLCHAGLDQLGIAGDARQRGFQFVADIGSKLAAHRLVVLAQFAVGLDRARQRDQFFVGDVGLDGIEVFGQMIDGLHQAAGQPPGQHGRCQ